jgi:hypothetical protein
VLHVPRRVVAPTPRPADPLETATAPDIASYSNGVGQHGRHRPERACSRATTTSVPADVSACVMAAATATAKKACLARDDY